MNTLDLMLKAERRDPAALPSNAEEQMLCGYGPTLPGSQWSVSGIVREETEMELAVFNEADPMELYHEKEYYLDHPEACECGMCESDAAYATAAGPLCAACCREAGLHPLGG